jgi:hypothetical protein
MNNQRTGVLLLSLCLVAPLGCADDGPVNIGSTKAIGSQLSDYAAAWTGYTQAFTFPDGSDHVRLTIDSEGHGFLQVGESALLAPPSDPHLGYPPGAGGAFKTTGIGPPYPGFQYSLHATVVESARIRVGVDLNDVYKDWCALQTPIALTTNPYGGEGGYGCAPSWTKIEHALDSETCTLFSPDGSTAIVNCDWLSQCWFPPLCTCTAEGCHANLIAEGTAVAGYPLQIDGALDASGSVLTGTLLNRPDGRVPVILQKQN